MILVIAGVAVVAVLLMLAAFLFGLMVGAELARQQRPPRAPRISPADPSQINHHDRRT